MNAKLNIALLVAFTSTSMFGAGELGLFKGLVNLNEKGMANAVYGVIVAPDEKAAAVKIFQKKWTGEEPKAMGAEVEVPWTEKDTTTSAKFAKLFGSDKKSYGSEVLKTIEQKEGKGAAKKAVEAIKLPA